MLFGNQNSPTVFSRHVKVRWIVHESHIYHRVEKSLLYPNPLSVNSANSFILLEQSTVTNEDIITSKKRQRKAEKWQNRISHVR